MAVPKRPSRATLGEGVYYAREDCAGIGRRLLIWTIDLVAIVKHEARAGEENRRCTCPTELRTLSRADQAIIDRAAIAAALNCIARHSDP